ncbi:MULTISPECIES: hypothetical protein [unclassified Candidatus Frackibacter]|nr:MULTISPECIES: hypothetical protein [unclassified Candidatus Frackibacter]
MTVDSEAQKRVFGLEVESIVGLRPALNFKLGETVKPRKIQVKVKVKKFA